MHPIKNSKFFLLLLVIGVTTNSAEEEEKRIPSPLVVPSYQKKFDRFLRGGSYSRGGSSSYHSGSSSWSSSRSSYHSNNGYNYSRNRSYNYNRGGGSMGRVFQGILLAGFGLLVLGLLFGSGALSACLPLLCCCGAGAAAAAASGATGSSSSGNHYVNEGYNNHNYYPNRNNTYGSNNNQYEFQNRVQQARGEVESMSIHVRSQQNHSIEPFSGHYTTTFVDPESGKHHSASLCLFFTPDSSGNGYRIHGQGSDIDGSTVIECGFANYDGNAWWIEKNITGDMSLQVLSRGIFNFRQRTFEGIWLANTMLSGPYLSFVAIEANPNQNYHSSPSPMAGGGNIQSVPIVTGTAVSSTTIVAQSDHVPVTVVGSPV